MSIELLELSIADFTTLLDSVDDAQWTLPTACDGWDVNALVDHMIGGAQMCAVLFNGGSREGAVAEMENLPKSIAERRSAVSKSAADHVAAMRQSGALEKIVPHPAMDMPGSELLKFRICDYALHTWDLAHGLGRDVTLNPAVVEYAWSVMEPMTPFLGQTGRFGEGPSGVVPESAPLLDRLLDLSGRRP